MLKKLFSDPFVVLDTETTGVYNDSDLIELAAVCVDERGRIRSRFSTLINPPKPVDPKLKALQVNNISLQDLKGAPSWEIVAPHFEGWLRAIPTTQGEVICTAFNSAFDRRMLDNHHFSLRWGKCIRSMSNECMKAQNQQPKDKDGKNRAPSLQEACAFFDIPYPENAHRALADAEVTAQVAIKAYRAQNLQNSLASF